MSTYLITKANFHEGYILDCECYLDEGNKLGEKYQPSRQQVINAINNGHVFLTCVPAVKIE